MTKSDDKLYSLLSDETNEWRVFNMGAAVDVAPGVQVPVRFSFDSGHPPIEMHPLEDLKALAAEVLDESHSALEYGYSETLRDELAKWVSKRQGIPGLTAENFALASGGTEAIALTIAAVLAPGDVALIEALTFPYANRFMRQNGVDVRRMEIDEDGIVIATLERQLEELRREGKKVKLLYTISTYNLPTAAVLPLERRQRILELAEEYDLVVLEDAVYSDLQYDGAPNPPSMLSMDTSGRVIQIHTFSKIVVPGLRIGWACGAPQLIQGLHARRRELGVSQWLTEIMARYLASGKLDPHIDELNAVLLRKRNIAIDAMRTYCGDWTDFAIPTGGYYLWIEVDDRIDLDNAKVEAARRGVRFRADDAFVYAGGGRRHFRIPFASVTDEDLVEGIKIVGDVLADSLSDKPLATA